MGYRIGSGIYPLHSGTTTEAEEDIVKNILDTITSHNKVAWSVTLFFDTPTEVSINGGDYVAINMLGTDEKSVPIHSLKIKESNVPYELEVQW